MQEHLGEPPTGRLTVHDLALLDELDQATLVQATAGTTVRELTIALLHLPPDRAVRFFDTDGETLFIEFE